MFAAGKFTTGARRPYARVARAILLLAALGVPGALAAAPAHVAAVQAAPPGYAWAWGTNQYGQLGDGSTASSTMPVQVSGLSNVVAVAGGSNYSLALTQDGRVFAWGWNPYGELGGGSAQTCNNEPCSTTPQQVNGLPGPLAAIAAGGDHSLAVTASGAVYAWGLNGAGQLGNGTTSNSATPVQVQGLPDPSSSPANRVIDVAAGANHSLALTQDGRVFAWGSDQDGQLGISNLQQCNGQLCLTTATQVTNLPNPATNPAKAIAAGANHSLALLRDGSVWAWGSDSAGQIGSPVNGLCGLTSCSVSPIQVSSLSGVASIAAGANHSLAATTSGAVYAWGDNTYGQLGAGPCASAGSACGGPNTPPLRLPGISGVSMVAASGSFSLGLTSGGSVEAWGANLDGQLGTPTATLCVLLIPCSYTPLQVTNLTGITAIGAGSAFGLAVGPAGLVPSVSISPATVSFGDQAIGATSGAQSVTIANNSAVNVTISSAALGPLSFWFNANTSACTNVTLTPGASCTMSVTFAPLLTGQASGNLIVADNVPGGPQTIALSGNGVVPPTATPTSTNTPTNTPTSTSTPTNTPTLTPLATATNTPAPTWTPAPPTATAASPTATATSRSAGLGHKRSNHQQSNHRGHATGSHAPSLTVTTPHSVASGAVLVIRLRTASHAVVTMALNVTTTRTVVSGKGKHRKKSVHTTVTSIARGHGSADARGGFTGRLAVAYRVAKPVNARLVVTVRTTHGVTSRTIAVTIVPRRVHVHVKTAHSHAHKSTHKH